ncbi:hypothetical protein Acid7E03_23890 [Acidisoma sp. 7E03]
MKHSWVLGPLVLGLAGCTLPGRGLVGPQPHGPGAVTVATAEAAFARVPLVTIPAGTTPADYLSALSGAVQAAEARKPDVIFDVVAAVPQTGTPLGQITAAKALAPEAETVARSVTGDGVPDSRVTLGAQILPNLPGAQIRVYVR